MNLSKFPSEYDTFNNKTELTHVDFSNYNRRDYLLKKTDRTNAESIELNTLTVALKDKIIFADDINILYHAISNLQVFTKESFKNYFRYRGNWSSSPDEPYKIFNVVTYNDGIDNGIYMAIENPENYLPTDSSKWLKITSKGDTGAQGLPGINLNYYGDYSSDLTYNKSNLITWMGSVYYSTQDNVKGIDPNNTTYWKLFMSGTGENLGALLTEDKTGLVPAINEIHNDINSADYKTIQSTSDFISVPQDCVGGYAKLKMTGNSYINFILNGSFTSTNNWNGIGCVLSASNNTLNLLGNGTSAKTKIDQITNVDYIFGKKIFVRCKIEPFNTSCLNITIQISDSTTLNSIQKVTQTIPIINKQYVLYDIFTLPSTGSGKVKIDVYAEYADAITSSNKAIKVQEVMLLDLDIQNNLYSLTKDEVNQKVHFWFNALNYANYINIKTTGRNIWGSRKSADDVLRIVRSKNNAYLTTVDGRNVIAIKGSSDIVNKILFDKFKKNTQYSIQVDCKKAENNVGAFFIIEYSDGTYETISPISTNWEKIIITTHNNKSVDCLKLSYSNETLSFYDYNTFQLEEGSQISSYQEYTETIQDINQPLKSLPNGIYDTIDGGKLIQRISDPIIADDKLIWSKLTSSYTNVDIWYTKIPNGTLDYNGEHRILASNYKFISGTTLAFTDNTSPEYMSYNIDQTMALLIKAPKGQDINTYILNNKIRSVIYQLNSPVIKNINTQDLLVEPNGLIINDPVVCEISMASNDGYIYIQNQIDLILDVIYVSEINIFNGRETILPLSELVISPELTSFKLNNITTSGNYYRYCYKHVNRVSPTLNIAYPVNIKTQTDIACDMLNKINNNININSYLNYISHNNISNEISNLNTSINNKLNYEHAVSGEHKSGSAKVLQGNIANAPNNNSLNPGTIFVHTASVKPVVYVDTGVTWKAITAMGPTYEVVVDTTIASLNAMTGDTVTIPFIAGHNYYHFSVDCANAITLYGVQPINPVNGNPPAIYACLKYQGGDTGSRSYSIALFNNDSVAHTNIKVQVIAIKNIL